MSRGSSEPGHGLQGDVLVVDGRRGDPHARHRRHPRRPDPPASTTTSHSTRSCSVLTARIVPTLIELDRSHALVRPDPCAQRPRRVRQRVSRGVGVEEAVRRHPHAPEERLGARRRHQTQGLVRRQQFHLEADALGPSDPASQILERLAARRDPEGTHRVEDPELAEQLDRVPAEGRHRRRRVEHRDEARRVRRGPARQFAFVEQEQVGPARPREMQGDAAASDAAPDHHRACSIAHGCLPGQRARPRPRPILPVRPAATRAGSP